MKKFIVKVVLFFLIVAVFDVLSGKVFAYLVDHAKGGDNKRNNYICNETNEDILIFGSSRAIHHYNPIIIADSLGVACYNCGQDGNGAILNYGRYQLVRQRYAPKLLIYDITPEYDLLACDDNHKYLGWLRAYYDRTGIPELFESVDRVEKYKMLSQMYRYNSNFIPIVSDNIYPMESEGIKGFRPLIGEMDTMKVSKRIVKKEPHEFDTLKISYIKKLITESKDTRIIFVISPCWDGMDTTSLQPVKDICKKQDILFLDFSNSPKYVHHNEYFKDGSHLNTHGADEFTKDLMQELRKHEICGNK